MQERRFRPGEIIFKEGDKSEEAFIVCDGRVEILKDSPGGEPMRLAVLGERDVFGEMGLLDECPRSATVRACDDVLAVAINRTEFLSLLTKDPKYGLRLLHALFERLRDMHRLLEDQRTGQSTSEPLPEVRLVPKSQAALTCVPAEGISLARFPFRIGRQQQPFEPEMLANNDLELPDIEPHMVSLNHLTIDLGGEGVVVRDRGSHYGVNVNGTLIGSRANSDVAPLREGENSMIVGPYPPSSYAPDSPFEFQVIVG